VFISKGGYVYRRRLPHYRSPGCIYHSRFSVYPDFERFTQDWMFEVVESAILKHHKRECLILAYIIMANHAHVVMQPLPIANDPLKWCDYRAFYRLENITGRIKGRSSRIINQRIGRKGHIWQDESYDRTVRNERDLENVIDYVQHNPVRWRLVERPEQYRWSSAHTIYSGKEKYRGWFDLPMKEVELTKSG